jgi:hypothetical protein
MNKGMGGHSKLTHLLAGRPIILEGMVSRFHSLLRDQKYVSMINQVTKTNPKL